MERGNRLLGFLDRCCGIPLLYAAGLIRKATRNRNSSIQPRSIGIICLGAIGDLLLAAPLISGLHQLYPDASIEVITSRANAAAVPLLRHVDASFSAPVTNVLKLLSHIRTPQFDLLIDTGQWARISALLASLSGAKKIIGFNTPGQHRDAAFDLAITHRSDVHEIDNFLALAKMARPEIIEGIRLNLPGWQLQDRKIYCHLFPAQGKGRHLKEWPERHWATLIKLLLQKDYDILLTGSEGDAAACDKFIGNYFTPAEKVKSIAGKISLKELGKAFCTASAVISVNTGIMHLAALSGVPTIGLHGATNPARWGPVGLRCRSLVPSKGEHSYLNLGFEYPRDALPAMQFISVESVIGSLRELNVEL